MSLRFDRLLLLKLKIEKSLVALRAPLKATNGSAVNRDDELTDIANKCAATANELKINLSKLKRDPDGGLRDTLKKTFRAMTKKKEIEQSRRDLHDYEKALNTRILVRLNTNAAKSSEGYDDVRRKLADLGIAIESSGQAVAQKVSKQLQISSRNAKFLESLRFPDIFSRQERIDDAHRKTFEWIFQETKPSEARSKPRWACFTAWLEEKESPDLIYWIRGKPGAGKSTLMSYIFDDARTHESLQAWCGKESQLLTPSFFFWAAGSGLQKTVQGLLRSIIYQIVVNNDIILSELVDETHSKGGLRLHMDLAWTERRLLSFLDEILKTIASKGIFICFFLDGLDEYEGEIDQLTKWIFDLNAKQNVKVCVSSRPEEAFRQAFAGMPQLSLQDLTRGDIELYIRDRLESKIPDSLEKFQPDGVSSERFTKHSLVEQMLQRADGVFLWIRLVVRDLLIGLEAGESLQQLQTRLEETPTQMRDLYAHMLEKLPRSLRPRTTKYLSLVLAPYICSKMTFDSNARGDLSLLGLVCCQDNIFKMISASDLSFTTDSTFVQTCKRLESTIISCCAGLVDIEEDSGEEGILTKHIRSLSFIHRSVIDFLQTNGQSWVPETEYKLALIRFARANVGLCALVTAQPLKPPERNTTDANGNADVVEENLDERRNEDLWVSESYRRTMIDATLAMEDFIFNPGVDKLFLGQYEETVACLCTVLKKNVLELFEDRTDVTRWQPRDICSFHDTLQFDDLTFLSTLGFQRAVQLIEQIPMPTTTYLDRLVDYVSCSFSRGSKIVLKNLVSIARTAFERGADLEHSIDIQFHFFKPYFWPKDKGADPICRQSAWSFLIWRFIHSESLYNEGIDSRGIDFEHIECVGPFIEFCLSNNANPNTTCLIPVRENLDLGYFIHEMSISALVRLRVNEPSKTRFLQILEKQNAQSIDRIPYFVDTDFTVYKLNGAQSNIIAETVRERDDVHDFYQFNWGANGIEKIDETRQLAGKRVRETLRDATLLGSLKNGLVIGDETTYPETTYQASREGFVKG